MITIREWCGQLYIAVQTFDDIKALIANISDEYYDKILIRYPEHLTKFYIVGNIELLKAINDLDRTRAHKINKRLAKQLKGYYDESIEDNMSIAYMCKNEEKCVSAIIHKH